MHIFFVVVQSFRNTDTVLELFGQINVWQKPDAFQPLSKFLALAIWQSHVQGEQHHLAVVEVMKMLNRFPFFILAGICESVDW